MVPGSSPHTDLDPAHSASVELVGDWGFSVERYFLEMRIDFDGTPQAPPQPLASGPATGRV